MDTPVISLVNMKGGVGKTTLAVNLACALARKHSLRVLLVDIDPQFNATQYLMDDEAYLAHIRDEGKATVLDLFIPRRGGALDTLHGVQRQRVPGRVSLRDSTVRVYEGEGRLDLVPSELHLMDIETARRQTEERLGRVLHEWKAAYDYILIDCPPTISIFTQAAILASSHYLVPLKPDPLSTIGLPLLERWLEEFTEDSGMKLTPIGIVFCLVRSPCPRKMQAVMDDLREERGETVFREYITMSTDFAESVERHQPIFGYKPTSKWAAETLAITREFLRRMRGEEL